MSQPPSRRRFLRTSLRATGAGLGVGALGTTAFFATHQPRRSSVPRLPGDEGRPLYASSRKRVVVIGGGLAGIVAATELAARKLDVTLVERAGHLGGKLGGWNINVLGETFATEHGFHGFFGQYYNLYEHIRAAGAIDELSQPPGYPVLFADRPEDRYGEITKAFPLDLLSVVHQSKSMRITDFVHDGPSTLELMRWDNRRTWDRFDDIDFWKFAVDGGINRPMRENVIHPFGKTTLNGLDRLSAAEGIRFFHFFFIGNPEGLWYRYTKRDVVSSILGPLEKRLRGLGADVRKGRGVRRLRHEGGKITAVELEGDATAGTARMPLGSVPTSGWVATAGPDGSAVYVRRRGDAFVALDARCTHMGCPVRPAADGGFECPCHGGRYDDDGAVTHGPPQRALRHLPVVAQGDELVLGDTAVTQPDVLSCDYAVSACEVRGTRDLLRRSELGVPALDHRVQSLREADPFLVYRVWLDKPVRPDRSAFYTSSRFGIVDSVAIYSILQDSYRDWAHRTGGSVLELHAYAVTPGELRSADDNAGRMLAELRRILPELADAKVLHGEYSQQPTFSGFPPGSHRDRPRTETELPNLFLAGDHVKTDVAAALMEAAVISGRLAANAILRKEGLREILIPTVADRGPLA